MFKHRSNTLLVSAALVFCAYPAGVSFAAPQEVVISATRIETPLSELGSSVVVWSAQQIAQTQETRVSEVLSRVSGVDVVRSGGAGGNTAVFIRGANSEHTLVLVDGIEVNNPGSTNRAFNFADLSLDNVERIEVLRGPQSVLYGSDALGGVINIVTKRGTGKPSGAVSFEGGSYSTFIEKGQLSGGTDAVNYSLAASREDSAGISAARASYGNSEHDGYENTSFAGRLGFTPSEQIEANLFLRYTDARTDLDNFGGAGGDDPNRLLNNAQLFTRAELATKLLEGRLTQKLGVSWSDHDLDDDNDPDAEHPTDLLRSNFEGSLLKVDLQNNYEIADWNTITVGLETEQEEASSRYFSDGVFGPFEDNLDERDARTNGVYLQDSITWQERFFTTLGIRVDDHDQFGSEVTWRVAPTYLIQSTGTRFKGTYGTGFKAPSLVQLYSSFGNPDLEAEESQGWDIGIEQSFCEDALQVGLGYFSNDFDQLISFNPATFISENIAEAESRGLESSITYELSDATKLWAAYTYTDSEDESTGASLLRRARHKASISVATTLPNKTELTLSYVLVGSRFDNDFSSFEPVRTTLASYGLVNIAAHHPLTEQVELFARVENLFDKEYEEVLGFGTLGLAAYGGIRVRM